MRHGNQLKTPSKERGTGSEMQRYNIKYYHICSDGLICLDPLEPAEDGEFVKYEDVENLPPAEFPLDTVTGATVDFLYTTAEDVAMAGSVITAAYDEQIFRVVFTAPAEFYGAALQWFNPMYQSFKILPADEMIQK